MAGDDNVATTPDTGATSSSCCSRSSCHSSSCHGGVRACTPGPREYGSVRKLKILHAKHPKGLFKGSRRGVEKESLRVDHDTGFLSQVDHPTVIGRPLTHPSITTDFAECLLEFVTAPYESYDDVIKELDECHRFVYDNIGTELVWPSSMPCIMRSDPNFIPLAKFGSSNSGMMKHVYRAGLSHRYGRKMQTIAGIHYNFSFGDTFWDVLKEMQVEDEHLDVDTDRRTFVDRSYMSLVRNYLRYVWLIPYLTGSSPAICGSFMKGLPERKDFIPFGTTGSLTIPQGTSLRVSDVGYSSASQDSLHISYSTLEDYVRDLEKALVKPADEYKDIGILDDDGNWKQLSENVLQIENEFYNPIRPKQVVNCCERPTLALRRRGVEYIEVRAVDLDPFLPLGINEEVMRFLDVFLVFLQLEDSPDIGECEASEHMKANLLSVALRGRDPELQVYDLMQDAPRTLTLWIKDVFAQLGPIAEIMDENTEGEEDKWVEGVGPYACAVQAFLRKVDDNSLLPSTKTLDIMTEKNQGFFDFVMDLARKHEEHFKSRPLDEVTVQKYVAMGEESVRAQAEVEASDSLTFAQYVAHYFEGLPAFSPDDDVAAVPVCCPKPVLASLANGGGALGGCSPQKRRQRTASNSSAKQ
eukprot:TRINITY_DN278_c1_g1_i2.p1 TRINITY_DN278_c1_g1~~TRINITY_DN278_c1_g1_i2.p1  ORF type:complete len:640 (+),score=143.94 TRINITY_DN278_c1_g1_i2:178-2097(+)